MAAIVRRNWPVFLVLACAAMLALSIVMPQIFQHSTVAEVTDPPAAPTYTVQSPEDYDGLRHLRNELSLDNDALVALNPTADAAEQVFTALRGWYEQNKPALQAQDLAVAQKQLAIRQIDHHLRTGGRMPNAGAARAQAEQEFVAAQARRQSLTQGAVAAATTGLSDEQKTLLATLQANRGEPLPYRLVNMTVAQKRALQIARRHQQRRVAQAHDADTLRALDAAWRTKLASILDRSQSERMAALAQYVEQASERVIAAQHKVLPQPVGTDDLPQS